MGSCVGFKGEVIPSCKGEKCNFMGGGDWVDNSYGSDQASMIYKPYIFSTAAIL